MLCLADRSLKLYIHISSISVNHLQLFILMASQTLGFKFRVPVTVHTMATNYMKRHFKFSAKYYYGCNYRSYHSFFPFSDKYYFLMFVVYFVKVIIMLIWLMH
jgi:hypothetical protein